MTAQILPDPKCFEAMDAPEAEDVTCSKMVSQSVNDLAAVRDELRVLAVSILRLADRLNAAAPI